MMAVAVDMIGQPTTVAWGDQGNGTYINPILNADYSDPDVIRVGEKYYMVASDFHYLGMQVLESADMVNVLYSHPKDKAGEKCFTKEETTT